MTYDDPDARLLRILGAIFGKGDEGNVYSIRCYAAARWLNGAPIPAADQPTALGRLISKERRCAVKLRREGGGTLPVRKWRPPAETEEMRRLSRILGEQPADPAADHPPVEMSADWGARAKELRG